MAKSRKKGEPKSGRKGDGNPKEAIVFIPLTYNDRTKIPRDVLLGIFDELYVAFYGWTDEGTVKGAYRMRSGQKRVEDLLKVSVILEKSQVAELEAKVARWCAMLGQETMLLKIADSTIKFVPPRTGTE